MLEKLMHAESCKLQLHGVILFLISDLALSWLLIRPTWSGKYHVLYTPVSVPQPRKNRVLRAWTTCSGPTSQTTHDSLKKCVSMSVILFT